MDVFERAQMFVKDIIALRQPGDEVALLVALAWVAGQMEAGLSPDDLVAIQRFKSVAGEVAGKRAM